MTDTALDYIYSLESGLFVLVDTNDGVLGISNLKYPNSREVTQDKLDALEKPLEYYTYKDGQFTVKADTSVEDTEKRCFNRLEEYPSIGDQLDDLFKQGAFSAEMTAKLQVVKDKYPKS